MLRQLGCKLPIQVWYAGKQERDADWMSLVRPLDVECVDALEMRTTHPHPRLEGWALKPYALLHSPYEEVLLLDADIVPVQDPTFLFETRQFRECGAVFWPDDGRTSRDSLAWRVFGVDFRDEPEMESGQVLVDKRRHWQAMNLCNWYNEHSDFYYQYVYGDKDTFRFAWHRLHRPYCMPQSTVAKLPRCLVQFDFEGEPLFQHRCLEKWSLAGNRCIPGFIHESRCFALLDELRRRWRPHFPTAKARDREVEERVGGRRFTYCRVGSARWTLTLGESGIICDSQAAGIAYWWGEEAELVLANANGHPGCRLRPTVKQGWQGREMLHSRQLARLEMSG